MRHERAAEGRDRRPGRHPAARLVPAAVALAALLLAACSSWHVPDLGRLYDREAQHHGPDRNPIVVIPGIMGSNLLDEVSGRVVWGAFTGNFAHPGRPEDLRLLALPMHPGTPLAELRDEVRPNGVLDRVHVRILGVPAWVRAYVQILAALGAGGYRDESLGRSGAVDYGNDHYTCFQFDYDWRRDNVENARRFARFLRQKRAYVEEENRKRFGEAGDVRFDVVAHSMGGLLLRYYLRFGDADLPADGSTPPVTWAGARDIERAVLVAPPNGGSLDALLDLIDGYHPGPFLPTYPPALLGTFPSTYQLLPRGWKKAVVEQGEPPRPLPDLFDPALWDRLHWGLLAPGQEEVLASLLPDVHDPAERLAIARDHLAKSLARARQLAAALDETAPPPPPGFGLYLVAGDAVPTARSAAFDPRTGRLTVLGRAPGDGTVLRTSALLDARLSGTWTPTLRSPIPWTQVLFLFRDHLGLTQDKVFTDNVLFWLLDQPRSPHGRTAAR